MAFLRKRRIESTEPFWAALERDTADAPAAVEHLARGERAVACDEHEANDALTWASRRPEWTEAPAPLYIATE